MLKFKTEDYVCLSCKRNENHLFKNCQSAKCTCKCVNQIKTISSQPVCTCGYMSQLKHPVKYARLKYTEECECAKASTLLPEWIKEVPWRKSELKKGKN